MIIQSAAVLAKLREKHQSHIQDDSRHFLCPSCQCRTKLYTLQDGRRKCSVCGRKFDPNKKTDQIKLKQYSDILVCFCLDFSAQQASNLTKLRYRLVSDCYKHFRILIAQQNLTQEQMELLTMVEKSDRVSEESTVLKHTKIGRYHKNTKKGDAPIFGIQYRKNGQVYIDVLRDDSIPFHFEVMFQNRKTANARQFASYTGFIRGGKFLRFSDTTTRTDGAEHLWPWIKVRMLKHHGIRKKNIGLYLKELEWKYNHRLLSPEVQALVIVDLIPEDFLVQWSAKKQRQK